MSDIHNIYVMTHLKTTEYHKVPELHTIYGIFIEVKKLIKKYLLLVLNPKNVSFSGYKIKKKLFFVLSTGTKDSFK